MKWYLVRHGEIAANIKKIYAGRGKEGLTSRGRQQARQAAEKLRDQGIDAIYCSPSPRAVQTAAIIGSYLGKSPILEESLQEISLGIWEGRSEKEIEREFPEEWAIWNTKPAELVLEGRERLQDLLTRVLKGIEKIKSKNRGKAVVLVTHVAVIRILLLHAQGQDLNLFRMLPIPNAEIFVLEAL